MRKYILRDIHGNRIEEPAPSMRLAVKQLVDRGVKLYGIEPRRVANCSGDCGDCNDARECATKEQAL